MIRVRQIKVPVLEDSIDYVLDKVSKKLRIPKNDIVSYQLVKKSIDARDKENVFYVYEVDISCPFEEKILKKVNFW